MDAFTLDKQAREDQLDTIISRIKEANEMYSDPDLTHETVEDILTDLGLKDDEDELSEYFGADGCDKIRDAENGIY